MTRRTFLFLAGSGSGYGTYIPPPRFSDPETPGGTIDGMNATFTLANSPNPPLSLALFKNGFLLSAGVLNDYTLSGNTITVNLGAVPTPGDTLTASYRY